MSLNHPIAIFAISSGCWGNFMMTEYFSTPCFYCLGIHYCMSLNIVLSHLGVLFCLLLLGVSFPSAFLFTQHPIEIEGWLDH